MKYYATILIGFCIGVICYIIFLRLHGIILLDMLSALGNGNNPIFYHYVVQSIIFGFVGMFSYLMIRLIVSEVQKIQEERKER